MMDELPKGLTAYKRTPVFDQDSIPAGLRREHRTKPGVWALIHVLAGKLRYRRAGVPGTQVLTPAQPGIVHPEEPHDVQPMGPVSFFVEFHAAEPPAGAPHAGKVLPGQ